MGSSSVVAGPSAGQHPKCRCPTTGQSERTMRAEQSIPGGRPSPLQQEDGGDWRGGVGGVDRPPLSPCCCIQPDSNSATSGWYLQPFPGLPNLQPLRRQSYFRKVERWPVDLVSSLCFPSLFHTGILPSVAKMDTTDFLAMTCVKRGDHDPPLCR